MPTEIYTSAQRAKNIYDSDYTMGYRAYDEQFINTSSYKHYYDALSSLTGSFSRPITVLDIGCGTGRFFHTLQNTAALTGIDISGPMLKAAKKPVNGQAIKIPTIKLVEGNVYDYNFGGKQFDFIYSVGVLGEHAPFEPALCNKLYDLLLPGGKAFFTIVDLQSKKSGKRKVADFLYPLMPQKIKHMLDERWKINFLTYKQLDTILRESKFTNYTITHHVAEDPAWKGAHHECVVSK